MVILAKLATFVAISVYLAALSLAVAWLVRRLS